MTKGMSSQAQREYDAGIEIFVKVDGLSLPTVVESYIMLTSTFHGDITEQLN